MRRIPDLFHPTVLGLFLFALVAIPASGEGDGGGTIAVPGVDGPTWQQPVSTITVDEITRGQTGYGISVFAGNEAERFEVEVLGVLRDFSPRASAIIARLTGQGLEESGVIAGMSGSPVYIDGRLAGAVAFSWNYAKEAIAGITPIEEMRQIAAAAPSGAGTSSSWRRISAQPVMTFEELLEGNLSQDLLVQELARLTPSLAAGARPGVVWATGGFGELSQRLLGTALGAISNAGTLRRRSGSAILGEAQDGAPDLALAPGSPVAAALVRGDLQLAATGTVTDRFGDQVLAFGHPFLGYGPVRLPMAAAEVITVISSTSNSFKLSNLGPVVGAFEEDRRAGILGRLDAVAPTLPLAIKISGNGIPEEQTFHMEIAQLPALLPTLMAISTLGTLEAAGHASGPQGLDLRAHVSLGDLGGLEIDQSFDGDGAATQAAVYLLTLVSMATQTPLEDVEVERVEVELKRSARVRTATLKGAHAQKTRVEPGETVSVFLDWIHQGGRSERTTLEVPVPADIADGPYYLMLGDGVSADSTRFILEPAAPVTYPQQLRLLRSLHSRQDLVVLGLVPAPGIASQGELLPQLPGSMRSLWGAVPPGRALPLGIAIADRSEFRQEFPFEGLTRVDLEVRRR